MTAVDAVARAVDAVARVARPSGLRAYALTRPPAMLSSAPLAQPLEGALQVVRRRADARVGWACALGAAALNEQQTRLLHAHAAVSMMPVVGGRPTPARRRARRLSTRRRPE